MKDIFSSVAGARWECWKALSQSWRSWCPKWEVQASPYGAMSWNRADPGVVSWWGHSRTPGTGSEQGSRKASQLWVKIGTVSKLVVLLYFCLLPSNACSLYMNESQRPRPPFPPLPPCPLLLPRPAVFLVMGPFKTFFDVHTNNIIFKYIHTHSFLCAACFWFSFCHFFQKVKGNMLIHTHSRTFSQEIIYHKLSCQTCIFIYLVDYNGSKEFHSRVNP